MTKKEDTPDTSDTSRTTNEKPVHIPLDFEDALEALLHVSPPDKENKKLEERNKKAEAGD